MTSQYWHYFRARRTVRGGLAQNSNLADPGNFYDQLQANLILLCTTSGLCDLPSQLDLESSFNSGISTSTFLSVHDGKNMFN